MKKPNFNIDKEALQRFFVEHSEKLIFGAAVIGAGMIAFLAVSKASFDETPEDLQQKALRAKQHVEATNWEDVKVVGPDYLAAVNQGRTPIDPEDYALNKPFDPQIFASMEKRGLPPVLLPVEQLRGAAGRGAFMEPIRSRGAARTSNQFQRRGRRWVVITGVFKEEQQNAYFEEYYREAQQYNPQTDVAQYVGYEVQRAEVTDSTAAAGLQWRKLNVDATLRWIGGLDGESESVVDEIFINPKVECPLLPRPEAEDQEPWPPTVVHPRIPSSLATEPVTHPEGGTQPGTVDPGRLDPFGNPIAEEDSLDAPPPEDDPEEGTSDGPDDAESKLKLFRFFDVLAEPGKTYRYRVRLLLNNPNFGIQVRYLKDDDYSTRIPGFKGVDPAGTPVKAGPAELAASETICTEWSQLSPTVLIPRDTRLLAVTVNPPAPGRENPPNGKVMVINWVNKSGIEAYKDFPVRRGKVINFKGYKFPEIIEPREERYTRTRRGRPPQRVLRRPTDEVETIDLDYVTESLVVDLRPGQRSSSRDPWPGPSEILVWNPDGSLAVLNELADRDDYEDLTMTEEEAAALDDASGIAPGGLPDDDDDEFELPE